MHSLSLIFLLSLVLPCCFSFFSFFFFFNDTATTEIYTLSLHDALPIWVTYIEPGDATRPVCARSSSRIGSAQASSPRDRKSTRLNSSHVEISYAVFCLKKKKKKKKNNVREKINKKYNHMSNTK